MKRLLTALAFALALVRSGAQNTTVSATMVDSDSTTWANATWHMDFRPSTSFPNESSYKLPGGAPLSPAVTHQAGVANSAGFFSVVVYDSTLISPQGSSWTLTLCANASVACGVFQFVAAGSSIDLSSRLGSALAAPRFTANGAGAFGYVDVEAMVKVTLGGCYWNVTSNKQRCWNGSSFIDAAGATANPGGNNNELQFNNNGSSFAGATGITYNGNGGLNLSKGQDPRAVYPSTSTTLCMDQYGTFSYVDNSVCIGGTTLTQDTGGNTLRAGSHIWLLSAQGAAYGASWNNTKSNRIALFVTGGYYTAAQNWGVNTDMTCYTNGECIPYQAYQTTYGGWQNAGEEANEAVRIQQQQGGDKDSHGGVWSATVSSIASGVVNFSSPTNANDLGEQRIIRDLNAPYTTGTITSCTGSNPTTCTGSGTAWTSIPGFVGTHTTLFGQSYANSNFCVTTPGNDGYDITIPITTGVDDTHFTTNIFAVGTGANTGWMGATLPSTYSMTGCAIPLTTNRTQGAVATSFTAGDTSGLGVGHLIDQVMAYNEDKIGVLISQARSIGRAAYGGGVSVSNLSSANAPSFQYGLAVSGSYVCGMCLNYSGLSGNVQWAIASNVRPTSGWFEDLNQPSAGTYNFLYYRDSTGATHHGIQYNTDTTTINPGIEFMDNAASIDSSGDGIFNGNLTTKGSETVNGNSNIRGSFSAANLASGPYANQVLDSQLQSVCASGCTWSSGAGTYTTNSGVDVLGNNTALLVTSSTAGGLTQTTSIPMSVGNTYSVSVYAQTTVGSTYLAISLNGAAGGDTACLAPPSYTVTTALQKFVMFCTPNVSDTMRVIFQIGSQNTPVLLSSVQVAGAPWCTTACTTTGPLAITTTAAVSGKGILSLGYPVLQPVRVVTSITPTSVPSNSCAEQAFTVTGAVAGQSVTATPPGSMAAQDVWIGYARVSAANTVALEFCTNASAATPISGNWIFTLI